MGLDAAKEAGTTKLTLRVDPLMRVTLMGLTEIEAPAVSVTCTFAGDIAPEGKPLPTSVTVVTPASPEVGEIAVKLSEAEVIAFATPAKSSSIDSHSVGKNFFTRREVGISYPFQKTPRRACAGGDFVRELFFSLGYC